VEKPGLWIRIRGGAGFNDFVDPDPYWESGSESRGKKIKKFQWKKCTLLLPVPSGIFLKILPLKRFKIA
jgi:hypothetical protein